MSPSSQQLTSRGLAESFMWIVLVGAAVPTLTGFLGSLSWLLDLTTHFRVQYAVLLVVPALIAVVLRRWPVVVVSLVLVIANLALVVPVFVPPPTPAVAGVGRVRVLVANLSAENTRHAPFLALVQERSPDVLGLLEVNERWLAALAPALDVYPFRETVPRDDNFGIALYAKPRVVRSSVEYFGGAGVPSIVATLLVGSENVTFVLTHPVPPVGREGTHLRDDQLRAIAAFLSGLEGRRAICGDLNTTPWSRSFSTLAEDTGLTDARRGFGLHATWPVQVPFLLLPLDHCLVSAGLHVTSYESGPDIHSDHAPVFVELDLIPEG